MTKSKQNPVTSVMLSHVAARSIASRPLRKPHRREAAVFDLLLTTLWTASAQIPFDAAKTAPLWPDTAAKPSLHGAVLVRDDSDTLYHSKSKLNSLLALFRTCGSSPDTFEACAIRIHKRLSQMNAVEAVKLSALEKFVVLKTEEHDGAVATQFLNFLQVMLQDTTCGTDFTVIHKDTAEMIVERHFPKWLLEAGWVLYRGSLNEEARGRLRQSIE